MKSRDWGLCSKCAQAIQSKWSKIVLNGGYVVDIGQFAPSDLNELNRMARQGRVVKVKALWPYWTWGTLPKTWYVPIGTDLRNGPPDLARNMGMENTNEEAEGD